MHMIRSLPFAFLTGASHDGSQYLLGWHGDVLLVLQFDKGGGLISTVVEEIFSSDVGPQDRFGPEAELRVGQHIKGFTDRFQIMEQPIRVQPFFLTQMNVGIKKFPLDLESFLANPSKVSAADAEIFRAGVESWQSEGNCVLRWNDDYYLDSEGYTI